MSGHRSGAELRPACPPAPCAVGDERRVVAGAAFRPLPGRGARRGSLPGRPPASAMRSRRSPIWRPTSSKRPFMSSKRLFTSRRRSVRSQANRAITRAGVSQGASSRIPSIPTLQDGSDTRVPMGPPLALRDGNRRLITVAEPSAAPRTDHRRRRRRDRASPRRAGRGHRRAPSPRWRRRWGRTPSRPRSAAIPIPSPPTGR